MKARLLLFTLLLSFFISCKKQTTDSNIATKDSIAKVDSLDNVEAHNAKNSLDYIGTYKGILPCADCEGLETIICINENNTYNIKTKYQGKGDKIFEQKGNFSWNQAGNTLILENVENGPNQYFVGENTLTQLDLSGKKISGDLAPAYILAKQPDNNTAIETTQENKSTVDLNNRIESQTVIKKVNPAIGKATLAETKWKLITLNGKVVDQKGKKDYFLKLNSKDGRFSAYAGCNTMMGSYVMPSAFGLSFSYVAMTRMACPNMDLENRFSKVLEETDRYTIKDNILKLHKGKATILATFEPTK
ncbi:copper resistance protein NlpE N-terminal domain-containing protein [Flavobacterium sp. 102]|uniref:copper resistance protein NlpE N-terminal domain-containing protein n=1 Tax=Flavobacterium sp. 102 TaxID=2135623 RepID=UPI000EB03532|nr:copper resistance protein NlpE N-terminal domain-containing protein [Flavobacterium sp. 102]RKS02025.1 META domain-containing protein [Flavobacterium sp. 102]